MRVEWTDYADMRRDQVADYIRDHFGAKYKSIEGERKGNVFSKRAFTS